MITKLMSFAKCETGKKHLINYIVIICCSRLML
jgi:hypothetical protein